MVSFRDAVSEGIRQSFCSMLRLNNTLQDYWSSNNQPGNSIPLGLGSFLYRLACDNEPVPQDPVDDGTGQCNLVEYGIQHTYRTRARPEDPWTVEFYGRSCDSPLLGPISFPEYREVNGLFGMYVDANDGFNNLIPYEVVNNRFSDPNRVWETLEFTRFRCDFQPDECGEPIPPTVPPNYNTDTINITYDIDVNTQITIPLDVTINGPRIDIDNNIQIPIDIAFNDPLLSVDVRATANFNLSTGDIVFNFGGSAGGDGRGPKTPDKTEPEDDVPEPPDDTGNDDDEQDKDAEKERIIRAALVTVNVVPSDVSIIFQEDGQPDIYAPNLGFVNFKVRVSETESAWLSDIPVKNKRNFVPCPWEAGAIDVRWTPRRGVVGVLTPIRFREDRQKQNPSA